MTTLARTSPLRDAHGAVVRWTVIDGMQVPAAIDAGDAERLARIGLCDLSFPRRHGVKGPAARAWLDAAGLRTPESPNTWARSADGTLVARLGLTEFAVVDMRDAGAARRLGDAAPPRGVYPVARFDADLLVAGPRAVDLFRETCAFDIAALDAELQPLVMTSMVGVGVTLLACASSAGTFYRLWCDGTYGAYLWRTLCEVAGPLGGGAVGLDALRACLTATGFDHPST